MLGICRGKARFVTALILLVTLQCLILSAVMMIKKRTRFPDVVTGEVGWQQHYRNDIKIDAEKLTEKSVKVTGQKCRIPKLNPFHPKYVLPYMSTASLRKCDVVKHAVVEDGVLRFNTKDVSRADLYYIRRLDDYNTVLSEPVSVLASSMRTKECWVECGGHGGHCPLHCGKDGYCCRRHFPDCPGEIGDRAPVDSHGCTSKHHNGDIEYRLQEDFFKLEIVKGDEMFVEYHAAVLNPTEKIVRASSQERRPDIIMVMFDSVSNGNFQRNLKKSYKFLTDHPDTVILKGHSIVGDGTTAQLCAMLTGVPEKKLPEARRNMPGSRPVDNWPWIFKDLHKANYKTLYSEDDPLISSFHFRLHGFSDIPTTKYLRPLWLAMEPKMKTSKACAHQFTFEYLKRYLKKFQQENKFAIVVSSYLSHDHQESVGIADGDLVDLYAHLEKEGHLNNTVVLLFGDHGSRAGKFRDTLHGKLEERLPFMAITVPPWFSKHRRQMRNIKDNADVITSHFDIHSTLQHIITFPYQNKKTIGKYGRSLFTNLKRLNRTCADVGVEKHWCTCLKLESVNATDEVVVNVVKVLIDYMNYLNDAHAKGKCRELRVQQVTKASRQRPNEEVQQFIGTGKNAECDACIIKYDKNIKTNRFTFVVNFIVSPSGGSYEATVDCNVEGGSKVSNCNSPEISRTNMYGHQPDCIAKEFPNLRKYCFCK